jgi:NCS1 family nucleobase:cation symporter-1
MAVSAVVYYVLSKIWPPPIYPSGHEETPKTFEYMRASEGYFDVDEVIGVSSSHGTVVLEAGESGDTGLALTSSVGKKY